MNARFKLENVETVQATLSVTMSLGDWQALMDQMPNTWPAWKFGAEIQQMLGEARRHFVATAPPE